ncbi:MAG: 2,4-dihydroxyhept-2-ene-1,7-dioic acid aldolase [Dehalococcoidia bacterium]|nr:2,4-dihydroxyhept-2-ene-1,7-dioic acid aldolase [Dehalococcoidia bacterium]
MRENRLRELLKTGEPTLSTHIHSTWPSVIEAVGHTGIYDYVEFVAEYAPYDLHDLDNLCRAAELYDLGTMIKIDQEPRGFTSQRAIGSGFQSVLFADCRSVEDARECVRVVRPETPSDGGIHGVGTRRAYYMSYGGTPDYVQALNDIVVVLMIEKRGAVEQLEEILAVDGIDMVQWGPTDYSMSIGRAGQPQHPDVQAAKSKVFETCQRMGVPARAEIGSPEEAKPYLDMGVRHFSIGTDISILHNWFKQNGSELRGLIEGA